MKTSARLFAALAAISVAGSSFGQVILSGTSYSENFNSLSGGLPSGWSVSTSASATTLGSAATFTAGATAWSVASSGTNFRNISSYSGVATTANTTAQAANSDRALGLRPLTTGAREGALTLEIANTTGYENFSLSLDLFSANNVVGDQNYVVEYRLGNSGSFTQIGSTYTTGAPFNLTTITANSLTLSALSNQSSNLFIRVRGTSTSGSGNLDTLGLDNFVLSYSAVAAAVPEPSTYAAIFGAVALLGAAVHRRRQRAKATPAA